MNAPDDVPILVRAERKLPSLEDPLVSESSVRHYEKGIADISSELTKGLHSSLGIGYKEFFMRYDDYESSGRRETQDAKLASSRKLKCRGCNRNLSQKHYSTNQWTKPAPRCRSCVKSRNK